jgi:uncharacterized membrane protein YeaQ/YmgE (transglycosylase-associated protein family)
MMSIEIVSMLKGMTAGGSVLPGKGRKIMGFLSWLVVGLIAGWLAGHIVSGRGYGLVGDIIAGVLGALIGGYLASTLFHVADPINGINLSTILIAALGAILLAIVLRMVRR